MVRTLPMIRRDVGSNPAPSLTAFPIFLAFPSFLLLDSHPPHLPPSAFGLDYLLHAAQFNATKKGRISQKILNNRTIFQKWAERNGRETREEVSAPGKLGLSLGNRREVDRNDGNARIGSILQSFLSFIFNYRHCN